MTEQTKIGWVRNSDSTQGYTFNPWIGCAKVSPGCDNCYAQAMMEYRLKRVKWGPEEQRARTSPANWKQPYKWNREAQRKGIRIRVFCASLADIFDNAVPAYWRRDLFDIIRDTPNLDWIIVTKRIGNAKNMLPSDWGDGWPNVWLLATMVNQNEFARDFLKLADTPALMRGLSIEPQLGPIEMSLIGTLPESITGSAYQLVYQRLDWVICGAESGRIRRPFDEAWARDLRDQCTEFEVPFFLKQLPGGRGPKHVIEAPELDGQTWE